MSSRRRDFAFAATCLGLVLAAMATAAMIGLAAFRKETTVHDELVAVCIKSDGNIVSDLGYTFHVGDLEEYLPSAQDNLGALLTPKRAYDNIAVGDWVVVTSHYSYFWSSTPTVTSIHVEVTDLPRVC